MTEWILIGLVALAAVLLATHTAAVAFVVSRIVFSGRPKQKQWSPKNSDASDHPPHDAERRVLHDLP
ncbi:hypothetical protein [Aeromicrobium ginsengisoli]|uniref:Uncharacterized protein n=1 Tax=Aeromicrobium ginsengisoli TaxID=363867 RepID=A0A5M4FCJ7_9ACTN|nr:hypothetical protein [Aeromicrobium ginsengisoli]KAA1395610.1 hypothetical protein ESP70_015785 [Aeromicrobium ginsengisoli]